MPIDNYIRPQLTIAQTLQSVPDPIRDRLTAVVIGQQYALSRYGKTDNVYGVDFSVSAYSGTGPTGGIPFRVYNTATSSFQALDTATHTLSEDDVDVYIVNGEAVHLSLDATDTTQGAWKVKGAANPNILVLSSAEGKLTSEDDSELYTELGGRSVAAGDVFYVTETTGATPRKRTVSSVSAQEIIFSGPVVSDAFATPLSATVGATAAAATAVTLSSTAGLVVGQPVVSISGTSYFSADTYISALGSTGVTLSASVTAGNGSVISFAKIIFAIESTIAVTEKLPASQFTVDAENNQVIIEANAEVEIAEFSTGNESRVLKNAKGKLYPSFRAQRTPTATESLVLIETASDIVDLLGPVDLENPLGYGANEAFSGSQGKAIYGLRTSADSTTAFSAALRKIEANDGVYALVPLTDLLSVQELVASHCSSMSVKEIKNFRRCYVGTDSPGEYAKLSRVDDSPIQISITVSGSGYVLDVLSSGVNLTTLGLVDGDIVKMIDSNGNYTGVEYLVASVTDADTVYLSTGPISTIGVDIDDERYAEFWKADTPESQAEYIIETSEALANRRAINVWIENATRLIDGETVIIPNKYVAAEIAGLRTAVIPWQGLTMTEITSVTDAPAMYTRYTRTLLDQVAAAGTMVVTQEAETGGIFIRHQLTTDVSQGSLAYEDSVGVSLDFLSFQLKDVLKGYIGKKNVTPRTINEIYNAGWVVLNDATTAPAAADYGPQLNGFTNKAGERNKLDVTVHPTFKDRVRFYARPLMPLPLNNLDAELDAAIDFEL